MLTKRQNLLETVRGGKPDRYVNQYEALAMLMNNPYTVNNPAPEYGKGPMKNAWGVTNVWPEGTPGGFPIHDEETHRMQGYYRLEKLCTRTAAGLF